MRKTEERKTKLPSKTFSVQSEAEMAKICHDVEMLAAKLGFDQNDRTAIETALSEICRNVLEYAGSGEVIVESVRDPESHIVITVKDRGPGIDDVDKALKEGFSGGDGLGVGLPGAKQVMDEFTIETTPGVGTVVRMVKWLNQ